MPPWLMFQGIEPHRRELAERKTSGVSGQVDRMVSKYSGRSPECICRAFPRAEGMVGFLQVGRFSVEVLKREGPAEQSVGLGRTRITVFRDVS